MAVRYLRIRGLLRRSFRVGDQPVTSGSETIVDLDDARVRRDLAHHSTLGAFTSLGSASNAEGTATVYSGGVVSAGTGLTVDVTVGELRTDDGDFNVIDAANDLALDANASGDDRVDLISVPEAGGAPVETAGTPGATPVAPDTPADHIPLATVAVADAAAVPGTITDVRPRP